MRSIVVVALLAAVACKDEPPTPVVVKVEQTAAPIEPSPVPPRRERPPEAEVVNVPVAVATPAPATTQPKPLEDPTPVPPPVTATPPAPYVATGAPSLPARQNPSGVTSLGVGASTGGLVGSSTAGTVNVCQRVAPCYEALARDLCTASQAACRAALQPPAVNEDATFCSDQLRKAPEQARPYMIDKPGYRLPGECG